MKKHIIKKPIDLLKKKEKEVNEVHRNEMSHRQTNLMRHFIEKHLIFLGKLGIIVTVLNT